MSSTIPLPPREQLCIAVLGTAVINTYNIQPRPGWTPDLLMVGIRSPDGLVVGLEPAK